ncbi:ubiquitin carboxyl-terminal hydrolase 32 [Aplysia californica]|uniref:ubiquitinyl hydrolase 1 n=1 Tax=Aplysia californica TaxID=6500 RepID=A0ABM0JAH1_APLCA|nr:ubiquitin carboxyl-terminal hydrolase 32 [Aplysia californica]
MGAKDSKLAVISYEDACKRVSEPESNRLREAFRRAAVNSTMSDTVFVREVLWDGIPINIAQLIYRGYGGTSKGLPFKDLLCGLVILTKGTREEKIKLIFGMYCDDSCTYVQKDEMDRRVLETEGQVSPALSSLFKVSDQVSYDQFSMWLKLHPDATIISKWLLIEPLRLSLSGDHDTPTFYQTLAGVTHLEEREILELEIRYWKLKALSKTGRFDLELFKSQVSPPLPDKLCESLFLAFDENCDNHIDFKEMACGISACCRGPSLERQKFCFKVFDMDQDGRLSEQEVTAMLEALNTVRQEYNSEATLRAQDMPVLEPETVAKEIMSCHDINKDGSLNMEDYLLWTVNNQLTTDFLQLLSQICHIVLGLSPQTKEEEGKIIQHWLERECSKPLETSQIWYLVNMQWWNMWLEYVNAEMCDGNGRQHRIAKGRNVGSSLAWEDESVIMVGATRAGGDAQHRPVAQSLHPGDSTPTHRSSSLSPKMSRKPAIGPAPKPPAINNNPLLVNPTKYVSMTNEGGRLRKDVVLQRGKDFELVPECIWHALTTWYGGSPALPRTVINTAPKGGYCAELELYPICVRILRHQTPSQRPPPATTLTGMVAGIGGMAWSFAANPSQPRRYHAHTASFSRKHTIAQIYEFLCNKLRFYREDFRLWKIHPKDDQNITLLEDEEKTVEDYGIEDMQQMLLEIRNKDLTWPEEMSQLAKNKTVKKDDAPTQKGATGLNNLGNTCFMNAAVQCVSNTWPLTQYFAGNLHLFELNRDNPLGMKGHIAQRYGELIKDLWGGTSKTVAPLKLRWTIGKYAPRFNGFQQHDSQELLSFLLDGLHEDLNRVHNKPYVELKDSDGRPDRIVAREAWENHLLRNQSIIVDLFHGILKSQVKCKTCEHVSVRFDPYSHLSLPLPMDSCIHLEVIVHKLDGSVPVKYGLRLSMEEKYRTLKREVSELSHIPAEELLIVEVNGPVVKSIPRDDQKIRSLLVPGTLFLYQIPPPPLIQPMTEEEETNYTPMNSDPNSGSRESLESWDVQRGSVGKGSPQIQISAQNSPKFNGQPPQMSGGPGPANTRSPTHSRSPSNTSCANLGAAPDSFENFIVGMHRKMNLMDVFFLSSQKSRPSLFGTPLMIPCSETTTNQELYQFVWTQIARLVSPLPPSETKVTNHALDCDDSLGYEYPFMLKQVQRDCLLCARCPWYRFCRGCKVECNGELYGKGSSYLAIDWEATALHLRYQTTQEKYYEEHPSVAQSRQKQTEPIDLDACLQAFTQWEELEEDELYYCSKCKTHCLAAKKLDIWRLPPILIINLKRFQYLNGRWVKSHKIVNFPLRGFDPSAYLAARDPEDSSTTTAAATTNTMSVPAESKKTLSEPPPVTKSNGTDMDQEKEVPLESSGFTSYIGKVSDSTNNNVGCGAVTTTTTAVSSSSLSSSSSSSSSSTAISSSKHNPGLSALCMPASTIAAPGQLTEGSQISKVISNPGLVKALVNGKAGNAPLSVEDRLQVFDREDHSNARYNLYAMSCHTGILGGGHYVAYAKSTNQRWFCYNDSSCKEIPEQQLDKKSAYILFYEREGVEFSQFMPDTTGCEPDLAEIDDEFESDLKRMCVLQ